MRKRSFRFPLRLPVVVTVAGLGWMSASSALGCAAPAAKKEDAASIPHYGDAAPRPIRIQHFVTRQILFATNRKMLSDSLAHEYPEYDKLFSNLSDSDITVGTIDVSIPKDRVSGRLARPFEIFDWGPRWHYQVMGLEIQGGLDTLLSELARRVEACEHRDYYLFVHGVSNTFTDGAQRLTQILTDIGYSNPGIVFSWPADGRDYLGPVVNAPKALSVYSTMLAKLLPLPRMQVYILAHSHGANIALEGIRLLSKGIEGTNSLGLLTLAHSDLSKGDFERLYSPLLAQISSRVFIVNSKDWVLSVRGGLPGTEPSLGRTSSQAGYCVVLLNTLSHNAFAEHPLALKYASSLVAAARVHRLKDVECPSGLVKLGFEETDAETRR